VSCLPRRSLQHLSRACARFAWGGTDEQGLRRAGRGGASLAAPVAPGLVVVLVVARYDSVAFVGLCDGTAARLGHSDGTTTHARPLGVFFCQVTVSATPPYLQGWDE
jgi:hypothetical protein